MADAAVEFVRVGAARVPVDEARDWIDDYLDGDVSRRRPFAFPAYDRFGTGAGDSTLEDGELLAPGLLNVPVSIKAFYELQRIRPRLQDALSAIPPHLRLSDASNEDVQLLVQGVYEVLDASPRPVRVGAVTLSKVLHRKRPEFLMLFDGQVRRCYTGAVGAPVPSVRGRTWALYMSRLALAVRRDLVDGAEAWLALENSLEGLACVSRLRLLDIVAWRAGRDVTRFTELNTDG